MKTENRKPTKMPEENLLLKDKGLFPTDLLQFLLKLKRLANF